jgi:TPP-dependent indolepyruvate ferredoxin oxidoreductase alpha subunit
MRENAAQVIAEALRDAAVRVVTNVPGFGGTQVFDAFGAITNDTHHAVSFHEEVAYSMAHGASLVGARSATLLKAHGLAKAANSVVDSLSAGVRQAFVVLVFDDKAGVHSDSILDVPALLEGLGLPWQEAKPSHLYQQVREAFLRAEALELPVAVLIDAEALGGVESYVPSTVPDIAGDYSRNVAQELVCPVLAKHQRDVLLAKLSGREWRALVPPALPRIPEGLPGPWQETVLVYQPFFEVFRKMRGRVVAGDAGISSLFAFPPYECIDMCTYMGGSIPLALGAHLAGYEDAWAVTGDFSFIAAGYLGLIEALNRGISLKVMILNNHQARTTGGQMISPGVFDSMLKGFAPFVTRIVDPQDAVEVAAVLHQANEGKELRIVVADFSIDQRA